MSGRPLAYLAATANQFGAIFMPKGRALKAAARYESGRPLMRGTDRSRRATATTPERT